MEEEDDHEEGLMFFKSILRIAFNQIFLLSFLFQRVMMMTRMAMMTMVSLLLVNCKNCQIIICFSFFLQMRMEMMMVC